MYCRTLLTMAVEYDEGNWVCRLLWMFATKTCGSEALPGWSWAEGTEEEESCGWIPFNGGGISGALLIRGQTWGSKALIKTAGEGITGRFQNVSDAPNVWRRITVRSVSVVLRSVQIVYIEWIVGIICSMVPSLNGQGPHSIANAAPRCVLNTQVMRWTMTSVIMALGFLLSIFLNCSPCLSITSFRDIADTFQPVSSASKVYFDDTTVDHVVLLTWQRSLCNAMGPTVIFFL